LRHVHIDGYAALSRGFVSLNPTSVSLQKGIDKIIGLALPQPVYDYPTPLLSRDNRNPDTAWHPVAGHQ
jgi:hypothetical protein